MEYYYLKIICWDILQVPTPIVISFKYLLFHGILLFENYLLGHFAKASPTGTQLQYNH